MHLHVECSAGGQEPGSQDEQQLQASMAQAALMHQMQTQYQSYFQQCVQTQQTPSPTPGQVCSSCFYTK